MTNHSSPLPAGDENAAAQIELKPCPFCGSQATLLSDRISCDSCLCDMKRTPLAGEDVLVKDWNTRTAASYPGIPADLAQQIREDRRELVEALKEAMLALHNAEHCDATMCNDSGCYATQARDGSPEPNQCEFCYENPKSLFNAKAHIDALLAKEKP